MKSIERLNAMNLKSAMHTNRRIAVLVVLAVSLLIIILDLITPQPVIMNIFFVIPVLIAAWYMNMRWALVCSIVLSIIRFVIGRTIEPEWGVEFELLNTLDWLVVLCGVSYLTARLYSSMKRLQLEVNVAEQLIPVCSHCKKIRASDRGWEPLEAYISRHAESGFTPGMCPECVEIMYGERYAKS